MVAPPADTAEGPAIAKAARDAGAEVVVPATRPAEMRDSIELGLERLEQGRPPDCVMLTPGRPSRNQSGNCRPYRRIRDEPSGFFGDPHLQWATGPSDRIAVEHRVRSALPSRRLGLNTLVAEHSPIVVELAVRHSEIVADLDTPGDSSIGKPARIRTVILPIQNGSDRSFLCACQRTGRAIGAYN